MATKYLIKWIGCIGIVTIISGVHHALLLRKSEPDKSMRRQWKIEITMGIVLVFISVWSFFKYL